MASILFTTDSAADIPADLAKELSVRVLPFPIVLGEREIADGEEMTPQEFYELLLAADVQPTHAALNQYNFGQVFEQAWKEGYTDLIHTSINSLGSSTYRNAVMAREEFYEEHPEARENFRIRIIDSMTYSMGYGWAVVEGARMARDGADADTVEAFIRDWLAHVRVVFTALDLRFARKSGRISAAAAFMGDALGLKPMMTFEDGTSRVLEKTRGERGVAAALMARCMAERREDSPVLLIRGSNGEQAEKLAELCRRELGREADLTYCIGGVVSANAGPNLVGLVYRT